MELHNKSEKKQKENTNAPLTSAELGKLWATYVGNTLGKCTLSYYLKHCEDKAIKNVLETALDMCYAYMDIIEKFFKKNNFPVPIGLTDDDVNLNAPRLFKDEFYLHYLQYLAKAGLSIYSAAIPLVTRDYVRDFFLKSMNETGKLLSDVNKVLQSKGVLMNAPVVEGPEDIDFVNKQSFLNGFFGDVRPLHGLEVAHLYGNINNDVTSKALILGFSQTAQSKQVRKYLKRGLDINQTHILRLSEKLNRDNIPAPTLIDHLVTKSTTPVFSDKLMVFHKIDMFSMKIREYANGASLNGRHDIGTLYGRCLVDVALYVEDGANIMIDHGWMEQPPMVPDRGELNT